MAAKFIRRQKWWIRFYHPLTGDLIRESLGTSDDAKAELLRQRLELESALLAPRFKAAELPEKISEALGLSLIAPSVNQPVDPVSTDPRADRMCQHTSRYFAGRSGSPPAK